jgi:hypothetical protein
MPFVRLRSLVRSRPWAWLLALALWLPVAQWAAATHVLVHLQQASETHEGVPAKAPCDVAAAALNAFAPGSVVVAQLPDAPAHALPVPPRAAGPASSLALAYRSRAPPFLHA